jgi:hypothetical protein
MENNRIKKDSFISVITYSEIKKEIKKKAKSTGTTMSKYLEHLVMADLQKDGITITVKVENKLI